MDQLNSKYIFSHITLKIYLFSYSAEVEIHHTCDKVTSDQTIQVSYEREWMNSWCKCRRMYMHWNLAEQIRKNQECNQLFLEHEL